MGATAVTIDYTGETPMRARPTLALAAACSLVLTGGATTALAAGKAKPKVPCNLITDPPNDADIVGGVGNDDALDIVSFDMASNAKKVTFVWRVKKGGLKSSVLPVGGVQWNAGFDLGDFHLLASVASDGTTPKGIFAEKATGNNRVIGFYDAKIDTAKNEVRVTIPTADFPDKIHTGTAFTAFSLDTTNGVIVLDNAVVSGSGGGLYGDTADAPSAVYKSGSANCVVVGK